MQAVIAAAWGKRAYNTALILSEKSVFSARLEAVQCISFISQKL